MTVGPVARDAATAVFFDGTARGELLLRRCPAGHFSEPTAEQCTTCGEVDLRWTPSLGGATLVSWTVVHGKAAGRGSAPWHVSAIGEMTEGPWLWLRLEGADPATLSLGQDLRVDFRRPDDDPGHETVPVWIPAHSPQGAPEGTGE